MNTLIALAAAAASMSLSANATLDDEDESPEDDGDGEEAEPTPAPKKKVKKGGKKVKKSEKSAKSNGSAKADKNVVRLKDLAKQSKLTEAVCRKKLRDADVPRGEGRWTFELGSKALKSARKALGLGVG